MSIRAKVVTALPAKTDVLVVPAAAGKLSGLPELNEFKRRGFKALWGTAEIVVPTMTAGRLARQGRSVFIAAVGIGDAKAAADYQAEGWRRGIARVVQDARRHGLHQITVDLHDWPDAARAAAAAFEGADLANYRFTEYREELKKEQRAKAVRELVLVVSKKDEKDVKAVLRKTKDVLAGVELARHLVNQPASAMSPAELVSTAREIAKHSDQISVKVLNRQQAAREGMAAFLAVAQGSQQEPYVIHLIYRPTTPAERKVAFVGKGVTFDSGGLSLKPAEGMEFMKCDMAGAASVLGVFATLGRLAPTVEVHGIIATCENMPSGTAYRPGDVLTAKNGTTIEVLNTDAEGRITLADALSYAVEQKPDVIVDLATLTGACMVALGETVAGLWTNSEDVRTQLLVASRESGEQVSSMPLPEELRASINSQVADVKNITASKWGGAITAALFLREFVGAMPWAHLDIAGPSWAERSVLPYHNHGGTGFGVRLLAAFLDT